MKTVPVKVVYLQMLKRPEHNTSPPIEGTEVVRTKKPPAAFYRFLYNAVGQDWNWIDRELLSDEDLSQIIHNDLVEIYVLHAGGKPAGYAELDRRTEGEIELAYLGIMPESTGKGLGRYLLHWAIEKAWSHDPERIWLHTCELDHPAAMPMYLEAGFEVFDQRVIEQVVRE